MAIRDKMKERPANTTRDGKSPKGKAIMDAASQRGIDDLVLRSDCPCPSSDCPHKGNCAACINYHRMLSTLLGTRMTIPGCSYFSERDYWLEKRRTTKSPEVKEAIDEWLAYYRDAHNRRNVMTRDSDFMDWDRKFEDAVNKKWAEKYLDKDGKPIPAEEREKRVAENKKASQKVPGAYPYK